LKQEIENLKSGKSSNESEDSSYQLKVAELEAQLLQSIRKEDYDNLTAELNQRQIQLEEVTGERDLLNEVVDNLQKELDVLKSTNESIIANLDKLKKEAEDDKSYIEELKDQVGNLRLNSAVKEPSVREMSILLESNRKLVEKIEAAEAAIDKAREEKNNEESKSQTFVKEIETLTKKLETVQDELVAHRTYVSWLSHRLLLLCNIVLIIYG
jgi:chromosome segregation ATPase